MRKLSKILPHVSLQFHQERAKNKLKNSDSILLYHGVGTGKTLTSIASTEGLNTDVVVPAALRENFKKELKNFTDGKELHDIVSYEHATKNPLQGKDAIILDEVQRLGNSSSSRTKSILENINKYKKRIILSGTPIRNKPHELASIIRILNPEGGHKVPLSESDFNKLFLKEKTINNGFIDKLKGLTPEVTYVPQNLHIIKNLIKGKVDYHMPDLGHYPDRIDKIKEIEMSKEQADMYHFVTGAANPLLAYKIRKNLPLSKQESTQLNSFMTAARVVSNSTLPYGGNEISNKFKTAVEDIKIGIKNDPNFKAMVYSNYLDGGLYPYSHLLEKEGISHAIFNGKIDDKQRKEIVDDFNNNKTKVILLSSAGSEGISLKGTRMVQILEPHWHSARIEQAIGRAIRYKSHDHLPQEERKVDVVKYHSKLPKTKFQDILNQKAHTSADQYLHELSIKKDSINKPFLDMLKEEGLNGKHN